MGESRTAGGRSADPVLVGGMAEAKGTGKRLCTRPLGSGLGVSVFDPELHLGCLLHVVLPTSIADVEAARQNPLLFVDTAVPMLFDRFFSSGGRRARMEVKVCGAAVADGVADLFQIGRRNQRVLHSLLDKNEIQVMAHNLGGTRSRRMELDLTDGSVRLFCGREEVRL